MPKGITYNVDGWFIVHEPTHGVDRLFVTTSGGYLDSDTWRLSSEITDRRVEAGYIIFTTYTGSEYKCHREMEGRLSAYGASVIAPAIEEGRLIPRDYEENS